MKKSWAEYPLSTVGRFSRYILLSSTKTLSEPCHLAFFSYPTFLQFPCDFSSRGGLLPFQGLFQEGYLLLCRHNSRDTIPKTSLRTNPLDELNIRIVETESFFSKASLFQEIFKVLLLFFGEQSVLQCLVDRLPKSGQKYHRGLVLSDKGVPRKVSQPVEVELLEVGG